MKNRIKQITESTTYKLYLQDSAGGIIFNNADLGKYNGKDILERWNALPPHAQEAAGGTVQAVMEFIAEGEATKMITTQNNRLTSIYVDTPLTHDDFEGWDMHGYTEINNSTVHDEFDYWVDMGWATREPTETHTIEITIEAMADLLRKHVQGGDNQ